MRKDKDMFEGVYEVEDGYCGGSRPQHFSIRSSDLYEGMTDQELEELYEGAMIDHFNSEIYPLPENIEEFKEWARERIGEEKYNEDT